MFDNEKAPIKLYEDKGITVVLWLRDTLHHCLLGLILIMTSVLFSICSEKTAFSRYILVYKYIYIYTHFFIYKSIREVEKMLADLQKVEIRDRWFWGFFLRKCLHADWKALTLINPNYF